MRLKMKKVHIAFILSLAVLLMCIAQNNALAQSIIKEIRFESPSTTADRIIFELNGPHLPTGKALPGDNPRVYFDFPNTAPSAKVKNRMPANGNFIKQIRHAYHKGPDEKTRVVLDLVANQKMEFKQDFDKDTNILTITLYLSGTEPEPIATPEPKPQAEPALAAEPAPAVEPTPSVEPEPEVTAEPSLPESPAKDIEKLDKPVEDVSTAVTAEPEVAESGAETQVPMDKAPASPPEPEVVPEPKPEVTTEQQPEEKIPQVASIPPPSKTPDSIEVPTDEATIIQPMSEVGVLDAKDDQALPVLYSIEYDPKSNRGEMISFKLNGFHPPVVFGIEEDLPRIVCFFKNATGGPDLKDFMGTDGQYLKNIKVGKYQNPDNIRVVLELVPGNNYDLQQIFFKEDKVFMLIINKTGKKVSKQSN